MQSILRATARSRPSALLARSTFTVGAPRRSQFIRTLVTKRYTVEHETVTYDDATGVGIVSITDHAQSVLGDVVFVELPKADSQVSQGDQIGAVESVKAASDIVCGHYAPVSGTIKEINETLSEQPGLLNKSAEDKGWLCKITLSNPKEIDSLLTEEEYKASYES